VILFLHGTGGTAEWAAREARLDEVAPAGGFALVAPEALRPDTTRPARFLTNPPRWNDASPAAAPELRSTADDVTYLDQLLSELITAGIADATRVCVAGFSNGAGMAFRYAAHHAGRLAAIAPIAGLWHQDGARPAKPLPTFHLNGSADKLIPYHGGEIHLPWGHRLHRRPPVTATLEAWATAIGCSPRGELLENNNRWRTERFPGPVEFTSTLVEGLGHHWPGGRGQLNVRLAGPITDTFDLNPVLFEFFKQYSGV
jgi:polyhydroxybutyrate depolymerase